MNARRFPLPPSIKAPTIRAPRLPEPFPIPWRHTLKTPAKFAFAGVALTVLMTAALPGVARPLDTAPPASHTARHTARNTAPARAADISDAALVKSLPGFRNGTAEVNGIRLHYVVGGKGDPLVLLPGWPETWWTFHKIMPTLAEHHTVIAVDLRGMGGSSKPGDGYDKKTMARDIHALVKSLGYEKASVAGHDIGSAVAFSYVANFPQATDRLVMLEFPHPDESLLTFQLLPAHGTFGDKLDFAHPYLWWFAFNQVQGLPEKLLAGRVRIEQDWLFKYFLVDETAIDARDRAVYERAYDSEDAIRASNGWYRTFTQDIADSKTYGKLEVPVLAMGGPAYRWMSKVLPPKVSNLTTVNLEGAGHFVHEERPELVAKAITEFLEHDRQ
jgi:pimeloyl-ACP methyl ester carboxylesterase